MRNSLAAVVFAVMLKLNCVNDIRFSRDCSAGESAAQDFRHAGFVGGNTVIARSAALGGPESGDDLVKDKIVAINFIFTSCENSCSAETARVRQIHKLLGDRMGRDVFFYSISIDPELHAHRVKRVQVFVRLSRTVHISRVEASKVNITGGAIVRFQNV